MAVSFRNLDSSGSLPRFFTFRRNDTIECEKPGVTRPQARFLPRKRLPINENVAVIVYTNITQGMNASGEGPNENSSISLAYASMGVAGQIL